MCVCVCVRSAHVGTLMRAQGGRTALIGTAASGHADCARLLLDAGADTNAKNPVRASAGWVALGGVVEMDWCVRRHAVCISVFRSYFRRFSVWVFAL